MHTHPHSYPCTCCFIIPSSMLRKLAVEADGDERQRLLEQLERSAFLRGQCAASGLAAPGLQVAAGEKQRTVYDARHRTRLPGKQVRIETAGPVADATFADAAQATIKAAELRHGVGAAEATAVQGAWHDIGVV
jgi:hypothetical protein